MTDHLEVAVPQLDINQYKEIELDIKNWIESKVDEVDPNLYCTAYITDHHKPKFITFVIGGEKLEGEPMIAYASTIIHAERLFKQGINDYLDKLSGKKKLYWRMYPSIELDKELKLLTIWARLVVINA